jgi:hypothetical protein
MVRRDQRMASSRIGRICREAGYPSPVSARKAHMRAHAAFRGIPRLPSRGAGPKMRANEKEQRSIPVE